MASPVMQPDPQTQLLRFLLKNYFEQGSYSNEARLALDYELNSIGEDVLPAVTAYIDSIPRDSVPAILWYCDFIGGKPAAWLVHESVKSQTPLRFFDIDHEPAAMRALQTSLLIDFAGNKEPVVGPTLRRHDLTGALGRRTLRFLESEWHSDSRLRQERNGRSYQAFIGQILRETFPPNVIR